MTIRKLLSLKTKEIWWVGLSTKLNGTIGHETQKTRPCLVIANCQEANMATVIPFQSNLKAINLPYTHLVRRTKKNKLKNDSVAIVFQIRGLDYNRFNNKIGTIDSKDLINIKILMKEFLDL